MESQYLQRSKKFTTTGVMENCNLEEREKMEKYQVLKVIPRQPNMHVLKARWVFTRKIDGKTGKIAAFKARWVAKGYAQIAGIHFRIVSSSLPFKKSCFSVQLIALVVVIVDKCEKDSD
jgi:hypothetical protein